MIQDFEFIGRRNYLVCEDLANPGNDNPIDVRLKLKVSAWKGGNNLEIIMHSEELKKDYSISFDSNDILLIKNAIDFYENVKFDEETAFMD